MLKRLMVNLAAKLLFYFLYVLGFFVYSMPFFIKKLIAFKLAFVLYYLASFKKRIALLNLVWVFKRKDQESLDDYKSRIEDIAFQNYLHYGLCFLEILERFHWKESDIGNRLTVRGGEKVWDALAKDQGFFFLTAHLGNWELITRAGVLLGYPLAIVSKNLRNSFFDALWVQSRSYYGLELLKESGSGIAILKGIKKKKAIGFIFDQYTGPPHGVKAEFFHKETGCPRALALMAGRMNTPVIPAYMIRDKEGCLHLTIESALDFSQIHTEMPQYEKLHAEICNRNIEKWVLKYPEQFLWIHKRFKDTLDYSSKLPWEL